MDRKVQKVKSGYQVVIPKQFCDMIGIDTATVMDMRYKNGELILTPKNTGA